MKTNIKLPDDYLQKMLNGVEALLKATDKKIKSAKAEDDREMVGYYRGFKNGVISVLNELDKLDVALPSNEPR